MTHIKISDYSVNYRHDQGLDQTTAIFIHGCYWHRHKGCRRTTTPQNNREFWIGKFEDNVERDKRNRRLLRKAGWNVMVLWECEVTADPAGIAIRISKRLRKGTTDYELPSRRDALKIAERKFRYGFSSKE